MWGRPMNQFDLAMTNLAFSSVVLLGIRALGIFPSKQETESFLHFWRYVGWLMGIDEKWLIEKNLMAGNCSYLDAICTSPIRCKQHGSRRQSL